jgi:DNA-binding transcriptional ArsR family regulator
MPKSSRFRAGCAATPEALLLPFVPVTFDLYRPLKPRLRWAMQCLVSFADHTGRCFPSVRTFALHADISKSAAGRDLAELAEAGLVTRKRRPGGAYVYQIARRFLPKWAAEQVSQARDRQRKARRACRMEGTTVGVPEPGTKEKPDKKNQGWTRGRARFDRSGVTGGELSDPSDRWQARLRSWIRSGGKFWLADWGPRPNEPGCWAPPGLLTG